MPLQGLLQYPIFQNAPTWKGWISSKRLTITVERPVSFADTVFFWVNFKLAMFHSLFPLQECENICVKCGTWCWGTWLYLFPGTRDLRRPGRAEMEVSLQLLQKKNVSMFTNNWFCATERTVGLDSCMRVCMYTCIHSCTGHVAVECLKY